MNYLFTLLMGCICRLCGSHYKWWGLPLYTAPYVIAVYLSTGSAILSALTAINVFMWKITGHGDAFRYLERDNTLSAVVVPFTEFFDIDRTSKTYDNIFWMFKGTLIALFPAIVLGCAPLVLFSAFGYPIAYRLGFDVLGLWEGKTTSFLPKYLWFNSLVWGEFLAGIFASIGFWFIDLPL